MSEPNQIILEGQDLGRPKATLNAEAWTVMRDQAQVLIRSGFLPHAINTAEKAISIMMKGRELGVPPMYALSNIAVINGKPTAGAELMLALIYRDHGDDAVRVVESTAERCTIVYRRRGWSDGESFTFTIEDARRADLLGKDNWRHYPAAMLRARCISAVARLAFPDTIGGLYTPEELGASVSVGEDEEAYVIEMQPAVKSDDMAEGSANDKGKGGEAASPRETLASAGQRATILKLARLVGETVEDLEALDAIAAGSLIRELSRRYNELDPSERSRRSKELARERAWKMAS